jgi:AAA domain
MHTNGQCTTSEESATDAMHDWSPEDALAFLLEEPARIHKEFWTREGTLRLLGHIRPSATQWGAVLAMATSAGHFGPNLTMLVDAWRLTHPGDYPPVPPSDESQHRNGTTTGRTARQGHLQIVPTTGDASKQLPWLWWPYVPRVGLTFIDGAPGIGKTTLALTLAAINSQGWPLPDQSGNCTLPSRGPGVTLVFTNENSLEYTLKPKLAAAGAARERVHLVTGIRYDDDSYGGFTLSPKNFPLLDEAMKTYRPSLIILDPIQG